MVVGIDSISFYVPSYYLELEQLAVARGVDSLKYSRGLGQKRMAVAAPGEDIVTLAANAGAQALAGMDKTQIDTILFATESGIDQSKAAGIYVRRLLGLRDNCRVVELKQACYSATLAILFGCAWVQQNPTQKILILAADVARYGLKQPGEPTQGAGAVAIVLSANPRVLAIEPGTGCHTVDVMDFWRPNYSEIALVDGKYSIEIYLQSMLKTWDHYQQSTNRAYSAHDYFCFHPPFARLVEKAHAKLAAVNGCELTLAEGKAQQELQLRYCREIGNCYTAALYVSFISLLENSSSDLTGKRIGFYSYGSGCVAELFSGTVLGYTPVTAHGELLAQRQELTVAEYEQFYCSTLPKDGSSYLVPNYNTGKFKLTGIDNHQRCYQRVGVGDE